ncbi:helix-turn-helix transcriptional regulator [Streptomyces sp. CA-111067]|uniref:helix-turn-helix transcriptional regulator n=1 Tax=Streptomyces sp. CA-111067 TaxID=3240046 RepID=UPI003D976561
MQSPGSAGQEQTTRPPAAPPTPREDLVALALYQALRRLGGGKPEAVRTAAGLNTAQAKRGWQRLEQLRLVRANGVAVEAVEPDAALLKATEVYRENAAEQVRNAIELQQATDTLATVYQPAVARDDAEVAVEYFGDLRRKKQIFEDLSASSRVGVDSLHPGPMPPMGVLEVSIRRDREQVDRGVVLRNIYPMSLLQTPKYTRYLHRITELGAQVRLIDHSPHDLLIFDGVAACLTADPSSPGRALVVVRGAALLRNYVAMYEDLWLRGIPIAEMTAAPPPGEEPESGTAQERNIVRLLALGLSDDQIARKLGVSRRTVQRGIARLMDRLGATSRFEAGLKLAQSPEFAKAFRLPAPR